MKVAILGVGAIGGYIAARLSPVDGLEVYLLARSNYDVLKENGIVLTEEDGTEIALKKFFVEKNADKIPLSDIIFICVQSNQTDALLKDLSGLCHERSTVITLQNGLAFESDIIQSIPSSVIYSGTCWIKVSKISENHVRHDFGNLIKLGPVSKEIGDIAVLVDFFRKTNLTLELTDNVMSVQLTKLALNVPFFILMAKEGKTTTEILMDQFLDKKRVALQREIIDASKEIHAPIEEPFIDGIISNLRNMQAIPPNSREQLRCRVKKELPQNAGNLLRFFSKRNIELGEIKKELLDIFNDNQIVLNNSH